MARDPDLVFLANGPGDPAALDYVVETVRELVGKRPVFGICLGHQLLCRAVGLETFKLPFGHRGANHPVKDLATGRIEITSQNHGFAVQGPDGEPRIEGDEPIRWETDFGAAELSHLNLYDRTVEGLVLKDVPGATVQYHPEAGPGPHDAATCSTASWSWRREGCPAAPMPRRDDIRKILLIGSGPIVIGQAAEFDYSGAQACKVLLADGYEVVLVNSNPATIMTDPEFAHRTYVEPLTPDSVERIIERERPDALLPTLGGQTALNLASALHEAKVLERCGVELIGADYEAIRRAEDREVFRETMEGAGLRVPWSEIVAQRRRRGAGAGRRAHRAACDRAARVHPGRRGRRRGANPDRAAPGRLRGPRGQPDQPGAGGGVGARLGRVRARGDARPQRQRGRRLLDRERRPDGRPHRGQRHRGSSPDAHRSPLPGAARPGPARDPGRRGGDRGLEHPVRGQPEHAARWS